MRFVSSRGGGEPVSLSDALRRGIAPDGGLYLPEAIPAAPLDRLGPDLPLPEFAAALFAPFAAGDALAGELVSICAAALDSPVPTVAVGAARPGLHALELFHGPTGAFKDYGARFLMGCFDRLAEGERLTVLAATSGDTGGAVGCAAEGRRSVGAAILFPRGRVSAFQEQQLCCWGDNVLAIEVDGDFDDCQRLVKAAFADAPLSIGHRLTSANSINLGRLLPQVAYMARAAVELHAASGVRPGFIVPSGNLGHGYALLLARAMGLPVGPVVLATNANATLKEWADTGHYRPRPSVATLANAMDVGDPSNFERLRALPSADRAVRVERVDDDAIRARIVADERATGYVWCPHSATAAEAWARLPEAERAERPWIAAATAHPYKFAEVVEPLIERALAPSPPLAAILDRQARKVRIGASLDRLADVLEERALAA
ncbi:threonine synthase [Sphingomonas sp. ASV193]|uniref:threonine synthase n=1 Tax=Sphingomonas sp. ASV193 TaxID=3144405 RepID=UPI0032E93448